jgi:hypothetical protein
MPLEGKLTPDMMELAVAEAIWGGPAFLSNRAWIVWTGQLVRITFGEQGGPDEAPHFRTAIGMSIADAIAFSKVLAETLKPIEEAMIAQQKAMEK